MPSGVDPLLAFLLVLNAVLVAAVVALAVRLRTMSRQAAAAGGLSTIVDGRNEHALLQVIEGKAAGTTIVEGSSRGG